MTALSYLDFLSVRQGGTHAQSFAESALLAKAAEDAGYKRYWLAEHHGMPAIASSAVSVGLAHMGHATSRIRIGAGGIMLPNHNPLVIAEQFGTLDALFPGRIDLGLGRAPGADSRIANALRKDLMTASSYFPQDVVELQRLFAGDPALPVQAIPGAGANVEMWILGSSLFGAQLAAHLGLPYAFASHFAPDHLDEALRVYRDNFQPSQFLDAPRVMAGMTVIVAETDAEAVLLSSSMDQSFAALRAGRPDRLQPPVPDFRENLPPAARGWIEHMRKVSAIGSLATARSAIGAFLERTRADELIVASTIYDFEARLRSLEMTREAVAAEVGVTAGESADA